LDVHPCTDRERNHSQNPKSQSIPKSNLTHIDKLNAKRKKANFRDLRVAYMSARIYSLTHSTFSAVANNLSSILVEPSPLTRILLLVIELKSQKHEERGERGEKEYHEAASKVQETQDGRKS